MEGLIGKEKILRGRRVTAISRAPEDTSSRPMKVHCNHDADPMSYSHVITTTATPCLQVMDLTGAGLSYAQNEALRLPNYTPAIKLGIKFASKWWIAKGIKQGGQGKTDRPTRNVVYSSYALQSPVDKPGVLLACNNASTDAAHLGSFARGNDPTKQDLILDIVLHDLALLHDEPFEKLRGLVVSHHYHDWSRSEFTCGAWGQFGPGQFSTFFGPMQQPAARGNLFFSGELTSIYHGWVVGSLKSAYRSVNQMLWKEGHGLLLIELQEKWGLEVEQSIDTTDWLTLLGIVMPSLPDMGL